MTFSIIICTYNSEKKLPRTLDSILAQTFSDYEVVIVDGASTDGTVEIIKQYEPKFAGRLRWISEKDNGIYEAMNKGVKMAKGKFLNVVGSGDWLEKRALEKANDCLKKNADADAVQGKLRIWDRDIKKSYLLQTFPKDLAQNPMQHPALYYKKDLHQKYGLYDESYRIVADYLFCMKAFLLGDAKVVAFEEVVDNYVTDGISSIETENCERENLRARKEVGLSYPLVSIIMPTYNHADFIEEAINSVKKQIYPNWECIIVDDGSTDRTEEVVRKIIENDRRFKYIKQKNSGPSTARNRGIRESKGEYILPFDSDDLISDDYLKEAISVFERNPKVKLVYCQAEYFGEKKGFWDLETYAYEKLFFRNMIFCSAVFRRCDYEETAGYNENMREGLEDWDFWLSFLNKGDLVFQLPKVCFFYRIKKKSRNDNCGQNLEKNLRLHRQIFLNHQEKYKKILTKNFLKNFPNSVLEKINNRDGGLESLEKYVRIDYIDIFMARVSSFFKRNKSRIFFAIFSPVKFLKKYWNKFFC